ncbi:tetratricopeptide repeat protein [Arenimonas daejeonensis]|uniref:tetratricopeptide repeat protein n=1 Tax=Arenimonas daejeonensis TaxID=370777 RepID=UPI0011BE318B|nr:tetratricopeptide repeat protein [Arenimonas daejeonensis]
MRKFFNELRRRGVLSAIAYYAAGGWLLVQVATQVLPFYNVHDWVVRGFIGAVVAGFPVAIVVAWFYKWTPGGWLREVDVESESSEPPKDIPFATDASIAVLPFDDMSAQKDQGYFSDGLAEEVLNLLAQVPQLRVIARTSSFSFKGQTADIGRIARALNVANVLEGSVRKSGDKLRVTAQLIRSSDSSHLWSQNYDVELTDVFEVQDQIARAVVAALKVKLLPGQQGIHAHRPRVPEAYDHYLRGQDVFRRGRYDDIQRAVEAFERAVELDPGYAAAFAGLANARGAVADFAPDPEARAAGKRSAAAAAERAIVLAPDLADGYVVRGRMRMALLRDWAGAEADFRQALAVEPNRTEVLIPYALLQNNLLHTGQSLKAVRRALDADPLSWVAWMLQGAVLARAGRVEDSRSSFERSLQISPASSYSRYELGCLELVHGRPEVALTHFRLAGEAFGQAGIAMAQHTLGKPQESQAALDELETKYATGFLFQIAQVHAWRGDHDAAFAWLERACNEHDAGITRLRSDLVLDRIRDDPRLAALVKKVGFPD